MKITMSKNYIIHRLYYPILEFVQIFISIGTGIFYTIYRYLLGFILGLLIGSSLSHLSLETEWIVDWLGPSDILYRSYLATLYEYHKYNNPIC